MKKKILGILVVTLLIATALPAVGLINEKNISNIQDMSSASTDIVWSDNFDSYVLGQYLDGTPDDGGWQSWANNPAWGAYVVDDQAYSSPHSVEIIGVADIIHEFTGLRSGNWTFIDYVYVPSTYYAGSYMFFLSYYKAVPEDWFNQFGITFDGNNGYVYNFDSYDPDEKLPLIIDQWVEIRVEIDFESDWFECYYNDELLGSVPK